MMPKENSCMFKRVIGYIKDVKREAQRESEEEQK
jgi:hypothetical protein